MLCLVQPSLGRAPGFVLSVLATGAIIGWSPRFVTALSRWMPRWLAIAVAVPLAAQLACTPVVASLSGQVSLVAVAANVVVAPLVAPTTVLGLLGGLVATIAPDAGQLITVPAGLSASAIIAVSHGAASVSLPAVGWPARWPEDWFGLGMLIVVVLVVVALLPRLLAARGPMLGGAVLGTLLILVPLPTPGWPPPRWAMVLCDVGQGDGIVVKVSPGVAMVVDVGPEPDQLAGCLRRLQVRRIALLVLTHFHADHVGGIAAALRLPVDAAWTTDLAEPVANAAAVLEQLRRRRIPTRTPAVGERWRLGDLAVRVIGPRRRFPESASPPNDASIALAVEVAGHRILLLGDQEFASQEDLAGRGEDLRADVLKVAHHGSASQSERLLAAIQPRLAVISVGAANDYGHPAPRTLRLLHRAGVQVWRTDLGGDLAVVTLPDGRLAIAARGANPGKRR